MLLGETEQAQLLPVAFHVRVVGGRELVEVTVTLIGTPE
jgi:hypothetical protein